DARHVVSLDEERERRRWQIHLPAELYDGNPHQIRLQVNNYGRIMATAAFLFTGSRQIAETAAAGNGSVGPKAHARRDAPQPVRRDAPKPAKREAPKPEPQQDERRREGRRRLDEFLRHELSADNAERMPSYFEIIDTIEGNTDWTARRACLNRLIGRMQQLSAAANDSRPVEASVIIPAFEHVAYTIAAVISLLEHAASTRYKIIIGNNVSSDETAEVFTAVGGVLRCITHEVNEGFIRNCNLSAQQARGDYVVLLNNDTFILDGWLDELLAPFKRFAAVGLTGSKLLMPDGSLQEAGGIIWQNASGWNFGRGQDPTLPEFNYVKDVDYVSGAAIAIPKRIWDEIGGFDERYVPAYFDDSDLAFTLRAKGLRTLYAPASQVIHHEGITHGTDVAASTKAYQQANRAKFTEKWQSALTAEQYPDGEEVFLARDRSRFRKHMLVVDHYIPQPDRDAGSRTMFSYVKLFADAGLQVSFWPDNLYRDRDYVKALQDLGVEVLYGPQLVGRFTDWIAERGRHLDYVFLSRAHVATNYIGDIRAHSPAKVLYYGHDLTYERLAREYALTGQEKIKQEIDFWRDLEGRIWEKSDVIYYPAPDEVEAVNRLVPGERAHVLIPYTYPDRELAAIRSRISGASNSSDPRQARRGAPALLFVGGFQHRPNVDGARWLVHQVLPHLRETVPEFLTILAGSKPPAAVSDLAAEDVLVTGYITDPVLEWFYRSATVVVAPLRFGGGVKGKIVEALRFGVPLVTTTPGLQGLNGIADCIEVADTPEDFAEAIARLIEDPALARERALRGLDFVEHEFAYTAAARHLSADIPELAPLADGRGILCNR
ncbi:MAG: glycosyltransferase, partial [Alphaproteobacteria bacterium]|nr:glycosyltransferase [Alphaproteobacteria bacterium]